MIIPTRSLILLAFAALIQSQVLEVDFAIDANNRIVSMSKTIRSDIKAVITSALNTTVFTGSLNTTKFSGITETKSFTGITETIQPTLSLTSYNETNLVDDLWNILESGLLTQVTEPTTTLINSENISKIKATVSAKKEDIFDQDESEHESYKKESKKKKKRRNASKKIKHGHKKMRKPKAKKDETHSSDESDFSDREFPQEKKKFPIKKPQKHRKLKKSREHKKKKHCPLKKAKKQKAKKQHVKRPVEKIKKAACPMEQLKIHSSLAKFHTLPPKANKNSCLIEQTIVIPPQIISVPTIPPPISSKLASIRSNISEIIDERFYNCITNYAGTLTTTYTQLSVLPVPTTSVNEVTTTIFAPTTQVIYEAIYTPYTVTTTSTDTAYMVKVTTVCKGSSGCNSCELDSNGMVIPAAQLPPGIFATPINQIDTKNFDILGYVGVNPSSFRADIQGFYSSALISASITPPTFTMPSRNGAISVTIAPTIKADVDVHVHRRINPIQRAVRRIVRRHRRRNK